MPCKTLPKPSRTQRTVLAMGLEKQTVSGSNITQCTRVGGLEQIVIYENFNPLSMQSEIIRLNRARNGIGGQGVTVGRSTYQISGSIYMHGSGIVNHEPSWAKVFRACGFKPTRKVPNSGKPTVTAAVAPGAGEDILWTLVNASLVQADQVGMDEGAVYGYKFAYADAADATPKESQPCTAIPITLSGVNDSIDFDMTTALQSGGGLWNSGESRPYTYIFVYRTEGGGSNYFLHSKWLAQDIVDGFADGVDGTAYHLVDRIHDNDLADAAPSESGTDNDNVIWTPYNEQHDALTIDSYLDHGKYRATGVRGSVNFAAEAGNPFRGDVTLQGVYTDPALGVDNPVMLADPGVPPRVENIFCTMVHSGGVIVPIVKSLGIDFVANTNPRLDANAQTSVLEYIIGSFSPIVRMQVEVNQDDDWIAYFREGRYFRIAFYIHPDNEATDIADLDANGTPGARFKIVCGGGDDALDLDNETGTTDVSQAYCQLQSEPTFDDNGEVRVWNLEFSPLGADIRDPTAQITDNWVLLKAY